jgi:hypothetical protein
MLTLANQRKSYLMLYPEDRSRDRSVGRAKGYMLERWVSIPGRGKISSFLQRPYLIWGPPSHLSNGHQGPFPRGVNPTTHFHLMLRSRNMELEAKFFLRNFMGLLLDYTTQITSRIIHFSVLKMEAE